MRCSDRKTEEKREEMFHIEKPSDVWIPFLLYLGILSRLCVGRRSQPSFLPFFFFNNL